MKTSINYLPEQKRDDLRRIVECVLEVLPDCEMIILYGSYARNTIDSIYNQLLLNNLQVISQKYGRNL